MSTMVRFRRISQLWNWLPSFRGVAEHESIHGASAALGTSASALSRTIRLLEEALGAELFVRHKNAITLTRLGARLLSATRDAMRTVDDCILEHDTAMKVAGATIVGASSPFTCAILAAAMRAYYASGARSVLHLRMFPEGDIVPALLRGDLDVAVSLGDSDSQDLAVAAREAATRGVYVTNDHALAARGATASADEVAACPIVMTGVDPLTDGDRRSNVVASSESLDAALLLCRELGAAAVLPDAFVRALPGGSMARLADAGPPVPLHLLRRRALDGQSTPDIDRLASAFSVVLR